MGTTSRSRESAGSSSSSLALPFEPGMNARSMERHENASDARDDVTIIDTPGHKSQLSSGVYQLLSASLGDGSTQP